MCTLLFQTQYYCTLNGLQYGVNITYIYAEKPENLTCSVVIVVLLPWSGTKPTVSLKCAYTLVETHEVSSCGMVPFQV